MIMKSEKEIKEDIEAILEANKETDWHFDGESEVAYEYFNTYNATEQILQYFRALNTPTDK